MKLLAALVPYLAVLLGMKLLRNAWVAILLYHTGILLFLFLRKPSNLWKTVWGGFKTPLLFPAIGTCAMAAPVVYFLWPWFAASDGILPVWLSRYGLSGLAWWLLIPCFCFVHPVLEEIHWRRISPEQVSGFCWQDVAFAGYHIVVLYQLLYWPWLFLVFGVLTGSSIFWRWAADRFGGYGLTILTHVTADTGVVVAVCFLLK